MDRQLEFITCGVLVVFPLCSFSFSSHFSHATKPPAFPSHPLPPKKKNPKNQDDEDLYYYYCYYTCNEWTAEIENEQTYFN